jgi:transcriptional regulator GlxA family with amidase domain
MANKTSAVADEPIDVLFALHPKFNLMDFAGPLEVLTTAQHDFKDPCKSHFLVQSDGDETWHERGSRFTRATKPKLATLSYTSPRPLNLAWYEGMFDLQAG